MIKNNQKSLHIHQTGIAHILILIATVGLITSLLILNLNSIKNGVYSLKDVFAQTKGTPTPSTTKDCSRTSVGFTPLNDLGTGFYNGKQGGLYPGGTNVRPASHEQAGLTLANNIIPLNGNGNPDPSGKYVLLSIGVSNTTQEFSAFKPVADTDPAKDPQLVIVDGAQPKQDAPRFADPNNNVWTVVNDRLATAGVTPNQVVVAWVKEAIIGPTGTFPAPEEYLRDQLAAIARNLKTKFPNIKITYYSTRIYAGYTLTTYSPEPYVYGNGFSVKWLIEGQINNNPLVNVNYDPANGPVVAPWLAWGPYMWADGLTPRSDGLIWACSDFVDDGVHPSDSGKQKVVNMLLNFFKTDSTASRWFVAEGVTVLSPTPTATPVSKSVPSPTPTPTGSTNQLPTVSITVPTNGQTVSGITNVTASAADDIGIGSVTFYVDGVQKLVDKSFPYTYSWDTTTYTNGSHTMYARAVDTSQNITFSATVTVNVSN